MSTTPTPRSEWKEMPSHDAARLVLAAHPQRLADALDSRLSSTVVGRLQSCPRLHGRIAPLLIQRQADGSDDRPADDATTLADRQATFERLFQVDLREASSLAGAAWHALSLRQMIRGRDVADLVAHIGQRAHTFGLRRDGVATALHSIAPGALAERIARDGYACLDAWFSSFPPSMRQQLQVRLPPESTVSLDWSDAQRRLALGLMDPVLSELDGSLNVSN
ncbi:nodulation protein NolU [Bradyrhizobium sp. 200]|uniref:nodulation protein NolU n=1 Tax=Bradyrhizobium sp. 200 TaxID=2782665 RepID=UPI001FFFDB07|nr:nodulation protein NolU [Bradyrhizobium sp. 200]UPJ51777.1 nodulation protein NolU [Bradyrhizobium sp. 200]